LDIEQLTAETGVDRRQVRFLISEGIVPRPDGGRKFPVYGQHHVDAIRDYLALRQAGMSVAAIRASGLPSVLTPAPGVTVTIAPGTLVPGTDPDAVSLALAKALAGFLSPEHQE
jgi:Predicted transcriptional regulators